ncbi:MAG: RraA family protein [Verrucomicrobia bacterium]|nr:RraA family protein [Verrucomicrobiota bacterium]
MSTPLNPEQFDALRRLDVCAAANAIEMFRVRLRNEGFADARVHCQFPRLGTMLGYAATVRVRTSSPPIEGREAYLDRHDWWEHVLRLPAPRVVVAQDIGSRPALGACWGEVHANILKALNCVGIVTSGAVRDLPAVEALGFHLFSASVAVSHAYAHIVDFGGPVEIAGLKIEPGDLLMGDAHGILSVPLDIAGTIPCVAELILEKERKLIALCQSREFSLEKLRPILREVVDLKQCGWPPQR